MRSRASSRGTWAQNSTVYYNWKLSPEWVLVSWLNAPWITVITHRSLFELLSEHQRESDIEMVKQGEEEDRALNSYFKVGSSEGDLRYVNHYIAEIFQYFWKLFRLHAAPALQYWNSSSGKWEINQKQRQQSSSPISKPDAAERRGSVSADEQAQVAVWKSRNRNGVKASWRKPEGTAKRRRRSTESENWSSARSKDGAAAAFFCF